MAQGSPGKSELVALSLPTEPQEGGTEAAEQGEEDEMELEDWKLTCLRWSDHEDLGVKKEYGLNHIRDNLSNIP